MEHNGTLGIHSNSSLPWGCVDSSGQRIAKLSAFAVLLVVALCGNCLVCLIVQNNANMRNTMNYLLVNMAVSDLVIPLLVTVKMIVELSTGSDVWRVKGIIGELFCKLFYFLSDMSPIVSILSLVLISFDRFTAIVLPFKAASFPGRFRKYFIAMTWIVALVFCSPYFYFLGIKYERCWMDWQITTRRVYTVLVTTLFIIIPFTLLIIMYTCILYKMKTRPIDLNQTEKGKKRREISKRNITLLSFTVVLMFAMCWGPYFSVLMLVNFEKNWNFCSSRNFIFTVQYLAYSNAAINPLLYFVFLKNYRAGLQNLFAATPCSKHGPKHRKYLVRSRASTIQTTRTKNGSTAIEMQDSDVNGDGKREKV